MLITDLPQIQDEAGMGREEAALSHDGLHNDCSGLRWRALLLQNPLQALNWPIAARAR